MKLPTSIRFPFWQWPRERQAEALKGHYQTVFSTESGRCVLADILRRAHGLPHHTTTPMTDPGQLMIRHGRELLAHEILKLAGHDVNRLPEALAHDRLEEMNYDRSDHAAGRYAAGGDADPAVRSVPVTLDDAELPTGD